MSWVPAIPRERLHREGKAVVKIGGRQVALFDTGDAVYACNNRCPHEGYPLREGTLDGACTLTCNWHNWKFDLRTGANLLGGDQLRVYPTQLIGGEVWIDLTDAPATERQATALANLRAAFDDHDYDRLAREIMRFRKSGGDAGQAVAAAIDRSHDRLEFGTTHAYAAAAGWLQLHDARAEDAETRLVCLTEAIGHMAWDTLREPTYPYRQAHPYTQDGAPFDADAFLAAIEAQDEAAAITLLRGALAAGLGFGDLERTLTAAALSHYADFGHSLIYLLHTGRLIERLGPGVEAPLLLALVRAFVYATREDKIPEFRDYDACLAAWPPAADRGVGAGDVAWEEGYRGSAAEAMAAVVERAAASPEALHHALLRANAINLLRFDLRYQERTHGPVAQNVSWLDVTHGITFANAVRLQCRKFPEFWPRGLLQMACFVGRNAGYADESIGMDDWRVTDRTAFEADCLARIFDHGEDRYILSAHLLKTWLAAREEIAAGLPKETEAVVLAAVNRYLHAPVKRKHIRRTAHQAIRFVALED